MPKPLLPPRGLFVPVGLIFDTELPPPAKDTAIQLRALAWGQEETPPLSLAQLTELTGKSQSTLYGHMRLLRLRGALRWRPAGTTEIIVTFEKSFWLSENLEGLSRKPESDEPTTAPNSAESGAFQLSRKPEKPVKDSTEVNLLPKPKKPQPFQNSGKPEGQANGAAGTKAIQAEYVTLLGYEPGDWTAGEATAAKWIGERYTVTDFRAAYQHYKAQEFWKDKRLKLSYLKTQIPEFQKTRKPPAAFKAELSAEQLKLQEQVRLHRRGGNGAQNQ